MTKAALPRYMDKHLAGQDTPPGHRFGLYFPVWQDDWKKADQEKTTALKKATTLPDNSRKMAEALSKRQQAIALQNDALGYFPATSTSSFMTGIGNEHPLENGFAFLNPYGLPYLPGSSVKGVLRMAAEELALDFKPSPKGEGWVRGNESGWDMLAVWWLFGFDAGSVMLSQKPYKIDVLDEEANRRRQAYQNWVIKGDYNQEILNCFIKATVAKKSRDEYLEQPQQFLLKIADEDLSNQGVLCFWDVYPQIPKGKNLAMDILTPHHGGYFNGKNAPHDSEQPNPNVFLTVPPDSVFDFYCACTTERLPPTLQQNWQALLQSAFTYAFDWLGFGAKTAVGYGQMTRNSDAEQEWQKRKINQVEIAEKQRQQQEQDKKLSAFSPLAQEFIRAMEAGKWQEDKNAFWQNASIETWLDKLAEAPDAVVITHLNELFDKHYPGLRLDPDKVKGKKQKLVFSDRQRNLAKRLAKL